MRAQVMVAGMAAIGLGAGGCSFIMVDGPPARHESMPYFDCTSTRLAPVVDGALAAAFMVATASTVSDSSQDGASAAVVTSILAGTALVSAVHGLVQTDHCVDAKRALQARALGARVAPVPAPSAPDAWLSAGAPPFPAFARLPAPAPPPTPPAPDGGVR